MKREMVAAVVCVALASAAQGSNVAHGFSRADRQALKLVRDGVSVSLAHTIDKEKAADNPRPLGQEIPYVTTRSRARSSTASCDRTSPLARAARVTASRTRRTAS